MQKTTFSETDIYDKSIDECFKIDVNGLETAVYRQGLVAKNLPTVLFIHGIDGSHIGMKPLAYQLQKRANIVLVDLPGHGQTELPADQSIEFFDQWSMKLSQALIDNGVTVNHVIGHSFGCRCAAVAHQISGVQTTLLMPIVNITLFAKLLAKVNLHMRRVILPFHNVAWWSAARGFYLCHEHSKRTWRLMSWLSANTKPNYSQLSYRSKLGVYSGDYDFLSVVATIVVGKHDPLSKRNPKISQQAVAGQTIVDFDGGHLAPIESPVAVLAAIDEHITLLGRNVV